MAFKITPFYNIDNTPIYRTLAEDGVLGIANKNGTIRVSKDISGAQLRDTINHEKVHVDDMKNGLLWYDNDYMYSRQSINDEWTKIKRSEHMDGNPNLAQEKKASMLSTTFRNQTRKLPFVPGQDGHCCRHK